MMKTRSGEDTHHNKRKTGSLKTTYRNRKGMTPITENRSGTVRVFDENGQELTPTYPRRAKGLLKNGRAQRCVTADGEEAIILSAESAPAPPPDKLEEYKMAEVLENKMLNPEEKPEKNKIAETAETAPELPEIKSTALTMVYAQELSSLLDQLMDAFREANDTVTKDAVIAKYDITLEKYDRLVNPPNERVDMAAEITKRILQSCNVALNKLETQYEKGEIELDEYLEGVQTISAEMKRYANE